MRLSHQTLMLIVGVTLVHLVAIAALSPATQPSRISHPTLFPDDSFVGPAGGSETFPEASEETPVETHPLPAAASTPDEPVDLPARFRELPESKPAPVNEPVAEARPAANGTAVPRVLTPLPRS